jgi:hypothetical protein
MHMSNVDERKNPMNFQEITMPWLSVTHCYLDHPVSDEPDRVFQKEIVVHREWQSHKAF